MAQISVANRATPRVGLLRRLAAIGYDLLLVIALLMVLTGLVFAARGGSAFDPRSLTFRALLLTACWAYFAISWTSGGQTVGMRAWRLELIGPNGTGVGLLTATGRYLAGWLSLLAAGLGFAWCLIDREGLAWHDRISRTRLSLRPKSPEPQHRQGRDQQ